ncbi:MAG: metal-dependent hydrolase [Cytophagaceae bacterium]|nr:metal-dependent hydrolase [Gemmatimonadaceae bacterium]
MSAVAVGALVLPSAPPRVWATVAICAILPDLDAIGRPFGRGDVEWLGGHRALTHSLTASLVLSLAATAWLRRGAGAAAPFARLWIGLFLACCTHGILDAFTQYGSGIAYFAPWSWTRYRAPWLVLSGLWSDFAIFVVAGVVARIVIMRRGWRVPWALVPGRRSRVS